MRRSKGSPAADVKTGARFARRGRAAASALLALALAGGLAACTSDDGLAEQYRAGDNKGFIAGDFRWQETAPADRGGPVVFEGVLDSGEPVSSEDFAGRVLVVNFWYAACGPCRAEAPRLEESYEDLEGEAVSFLGINTSDSPAQARSFAETYDVSYPSVITVDDRSVKLAFAAATPIQATPTTLVLDAQGRVAARIIGELQDSSILTAMVRTVLEES